MPADLSTPMSIASLAIMSLSAGNGTAPPAWWIACNERAAKMAPWVLGGSNSGVSESAQLAIKLRLICLFGKQTHNNSVVRRSVALSDSHSSQNTDNSLLYYVQLDDMTLSPL